MARDRRRRMPFTDLRIAGPRDDGQRKSPEPTAPDIEPAARLTFRCYVLRCCGPKRASYIGLSAHIDVSDADWRICAPCVGGAGARKKESAVACLLTAD